MIDCNKTVLLITGCITPNPNVYKLLIKDSDERKSQYLDSIYYYIKETKIKKIVYCDNSDAASVDEIKEVAENAGKKFEWISFKGDQDKVLARGKGFGEAEIVKYAIQNSKLMAESEYFIKITGRLIIKNLDLLLGLTKAANTYLCPVKTLTHKFYINTRMYMMPISTYKNGFYDVGDLVDDANDVFLEHAFGICIESRNIKYKKMPFAPWVEGKSGSTGKNYKPSIGQYLKDCTKLFLYDAKRSY